MEKAHRFQIPEVRRAFGAWLDRRQDDLVLPVRWQRTNYGALIDIYGAPPELAATLTPLGLIIGPHSGRDFFDYVGIWQVEPRARDNRWISVDGDGNDVSFDENGYATLAALFEEHVFDPFADWLEHHYEPATHVELRLDYHGDVMAVLANEAKGKSEAPVLWRAPLRHRHWQELAEAADRAERGDSVRLDGLTDRQLVALMAATNGDDTIGSYDVTGLSEGQFWMAISGESEIDPPLSEAEREEGRRLLAERREPRTR